MSHTIGTLSEHLYGFADTEDVLGDMADFATLLRGSGAAQIAARRCLALVPWWISCDGGPGVDEQLQVLRDFFESRYKRVADEWALAKLSECDVEEDVLYCGWECRVEVDADGSRHLRCDGLRFADVTSETVVARRKIR